MNNLCRAGLIEPFQSQILNARTVLKETEPTFLYLQLNSGMCSPGAYKTERATPILGLSHGVFTDRSIFRYNLEHFSPRKWELRSVHERIINIRCAWRPTLSPIFVFCS